MLMHFEAVFLTDDQLKVFQRLYSERNFTFSNPVYQSWLPIKLATLPTEAEALKGLLASRTPTALPKKTSKRGGRKVPDGAARFNPISKEWEKILEEKVAEEVPKRAAKKRAKDVVEKQVVHHDEEPKSGKKSKGREKKS